MLTYEQCKALKDAGFPQEGKGTLQHFKEKCTYPETRKEECYLYEPTLSEMIGACGVDFGGLQPVHSIDMSKIVHWHAWPFGKHTEISSGDTPEEAVCNLFLALKGT